MLKNGLIRKTPAWHIFPASCNVPQL